jgi:hypothetical protein
MQTAICVVRTAAGHVRRRTDDNLLRMCHVRAQMARLIIRKAWNNLTDSSFKKSIHDDRLILM